MQKKARASQVLMYNHIYNAGIYPHYVIKGKSQLNHAVPFLKAHVYMYTWDNYEFWPFLSES